MLAAPFALRRGFLTTLLLLMLLISVLPGGRSHAAPADPKDSGQALPPVCGTWLLQQSISLAQLRSTAGPVSAALDTPGVRGFSSRAPWNAVDEDLSLFDEAYRLAKQANRALSIRFMAGRWTPARVFRAGAYYYVNSAGEKVPKPFSDAGVAGNPVFEAAYDRAVARMAAWSRSHGVRLLHLPWYGQKWAEIDNGEEIQQSRGYSFAAWLAGHKRLIDIGLKHAGSDLSIEFAMSGHWGDDARGIRKFAEHIVARHRPWSPRVFLQGNGLGVFNGSPTAREIFRGMQMYGVGDYHWAEIYQALRAVGATYVEIYTSSFSGSNRAALVRQIASYNAQFDGSCRWR
jgi:hypothetical protein